MRDGHIATGGILVVVVAAVMAVGADSGWAGIQPMLGHGHHSGPAPVATTVASPAHVPGTTPGTTASTTPGVPPPVHRAR